MTDQQEFEFKEFTFNKKKFIMVSYGEIGRVAIDLKLRAFRRGGDIFGDFIKNSDYTGRGWKDKLIADACEYLRGLNER